MAKQKRFFSNDEIDDEFAKKLSCDPCWYQSEWGFYRRPEIDELRKMPDAELYDYLNSEDDWTTTAARAEQARRDIKYKHHLELRDKLIWGTVGLILGFCIDFLRTLIFK